MNKELWAQIEAGENIRQSLSTLRQRLRRDENGRTFGKFLKEEGKEAVLIDLLSHEDFKARKNAALLMGEIGNKAFREPLMEGYEAEEQQMVKSAYLTALRVFDCSIYKEKLQKKYEELSKEDVAPENQKHRNEELKELSALLSGMEDIKKHVFKGLKGPAEVYLTAKRCCADQTAQEVLRWNPDAEVSVAGAGVLVKTGQVHWRNQVRTYKEMFFRIKGLDVCPADPEEAAKKVAASDLLPFLERSHKGVPPFYFRIEVRGSLEPDKKSVFAKKMAVAIERLTNRKLVNAVSDYELLIRLVENKRGTYTTLVRLTTMGDERFSYRREYTPESMKPINAAVAVALAREYMLEGAQVLDPFCGVGTLLVERQKAVRAKSCYGVDYKGEAIEGALKNTPAAGQIAHYVRRDFFDFTHEYLFDEIITDMPFAMGMKGKDEIRELYRTFFKKAGWLLSPGGIMILYTRDKQYVDQFALKAGYTVEKEVQFDGKDDTWLVVLRYKKKEEK